VAVPVTRYAPSRVYLWAGLTASGLAVLSGWVAARWMPAMAPFIIFVASSAIMIYLAARPRISICEAHLVIGRRAIPWVEIRRVDRTAWLSPLVVRISLADGSHFLLVYPGDVDSANNLLRHLQRCARQALLDGIPYRQFWGDALPPGNTVQSLPAPKYRLLRPEDEAEVERLYLRLKTVGHLEPYNSSQQDEK